MIKVLLIQILIIIIKVIKAKKKNIEDDYDNNGKKLL